MNAIEALRHEALSLVVVDDARTSRFYFDRALGRAGYNDIRVAEAAEQALEMVGERPADVVIADWLMPGMDGLEFTRRLRERDEQVGRYTGVILSTAVEGIDALVTAFRSGVDDFLYKPFETEELIARVFAAGNHASARNMLLETGEMLAHERHGRTEHWVSDPLTGLGGREYFESQLKMHVAEASTRGGAVCMALVGVSGPALHTAQPDIVLSRIGRRLLRGVRPTDVVCRTDERRFGLVMSAATVEGFQGGMFPRLEREVAGRPVGNRPAGRADIALAIDYTIWEGPGTPPTLRELQEQTERIVTSDA